MIDDVESNKITILRCCRMKVLDKSQSNGRIALPKRWRYSETLFLELKKTRLENDSVAIEHNEPPETIVFLIDLCFIQYDASPNEVITSQNMRKVIRTPHQVVVTVKDRSHETCAIAT